MIPVNSGNQVQKNTYPIATTGKYLIPLQAAQKLNHTPLCLGLKSWVYHIVSEPNGDHQIMLWLMVSTPLKNMKVSWDDDIPNIWENKEWQPNHQPVLNSGTVFFALDLNPGFFRFPGKMMRTWLDQLDQTWWTLWVSVSKPSGIGMDWLEAKNHPSLIVWYSL